MSEPTLEKIVSLIRAQPAITVKELARELGFSQERSVYYWLQKAGHKGLQTLKRDVLWERGNEQERRDLSSRPDAAADGVREGAPAYAPHLMTVATRAYEPWIRAGDELHIAPNHEPVNGDLVVIALPGDGEALRRWYRLPTQVLLTHPSDPRDSVSLSHDQARPRGVVVCLIRKRP